MTSSKDPVDRESLYNEVWSDPVSIVAKRYGLSDVGLAKICRKLAIPLPSRGYWAKVATGKVMHRVPLPRVPEGFARHAAGPIPLSPEESGQLEIVKTSVDRARQANPTIEVPEELTKPHPLVDQTAQRLRRREGWKDPGGVRSAPSEVLDLAVTPKTLDRGLRIIDTVLKALERAGITVRIDPEQAKTFLVSRGTEIAISVSEQVIRTEHTLTQAEKRARERYYGSWNTREHIDAPNIPQFDYTPTGRLTISAGRWAERHWNDTSRTQLEQRMTRAISEMVALIEKIRAEEEERARRETEQQIAIERYESFIKRRKDEFDRMRRFQRNAVL